MWKITEYHLQISGCSLRASVFWQLENPWLDQGVQISFSEESLKVKRKPPLRYDKNAVRQRQPYGFKGGLSL